jgi:COP9 signalosome complex subunit 4
MFLDQILRVNEVKEFEGQLQEHQLAKIPLDRRLVVLDDEEGGVKLVGRKGPENVLDKAVMEHNILACTKVSCIAHCWITGSDALFDRYMTTSSLTD